MKKLSLFAVCAFALVSSASASTISTGTAAPWLVNLLPVAIENPIATPYWINNFSDGKWVGTATTDGGFTNPGDGALPGTYTFSLALGSYIGAAGSFSLQYAADNTISWSITNGSASDSCVNSGDCFSGPGGAPRTLTGSFNADSVLTATVTNDGQDRTPMGLLVVGTADVGSPTPEPSTFVMLGLGGAAVLFGRSRRK